MLSLSLSSLDGKIKTTTKQIQGVESFVSQVNSALRQRHEQERLREILSRIESYDVVETKDEEVERLVKSHCDLDLTKPMPYCSEHQRRYLLIEGDLKLRDQVCKILDKPFIRRDCSRLDAANFLFTGHVQNGRSLFPLHGRLAHLQARCPQSRKSESDSTAVLGRPIGGHRTGARSCRTRVGLPERAGHGVGRFFTARVRTETEQSVVGTFAQSPGTVPRG